MLSRLLGRLAECDENRSAESTSAISSCSLVLVAAVVYPVGDLGCFGSRRLPCRENTTSAKTTYVLTDGCRSNTLARYVISAVVPLKGDRALPALAVLASVCPKVLSSINSFRFSKGWSSHLPRTH